MIFGARCFTGSMPSLTHTTVYYMWLSRGPNKLYHNCRKCAGQLARDGRDASSLRHILGSFFQLWMTCEIYGQGLTQFVTEVFCVESWMNFHCCVVDLICIKYCDNGQNCSLTYYKCLTGQLTVFSTSHPARWLVDCLVTVICDPPVNIRQSVMRTTVILLMSTYIYIDVMHNKCNNIWKIMPFSLSVKMILICKNKQNFNLRYLPIHLVNFTIKILIILMLVLYWLYLFSYCLLCLFTYFVSEVFMFFMSVVCEIHAFHTRLVNKCYFNFVAFLHVGVFLSV